MQKQIYTLIVGFSIQGDLAYLSHQETLKMFQRALVRASVPLAFSKGFNPHPRLSIPFPRSVGTQSKQDRLCIMIESSDNFSEKDYICRIQDELSGDVVLLDIQRTQGKNTFHPQKVRYIFTLGCPIDAQFREHLLDCQKQIEQKSQIKIQRYWAKKKRYKTFDITPCLEALSFEDNQVDVTCLISQAGSIRVDELMQWLNITSEQLAEPVCRTDINWSQN